MLISIYIIIVHSGNYIRLSKVLRKTAKMKTFTLSVAVILLLTIPQDGDSKPLFFGILRKLFGGGKGKGNSGGKFKHQMVDNTTVIKL